jgi:hypothetical protein
MKRLLGAAFVVACCFLASCGTGDLNSSGATSQAKDVLGEANTAYQALATVETAAAEFCASNPTTSPCPSIPFAQIKQADDEIYANLSAANNAAAQSNASAQSIAMASLGQALPKALALIPPTGNPEVDLALSLLKGAVETYVSDLAAQTPAMAASSS